METTEGPINLSHSSCTDTEQTLQPESTSTQVVNQLDGVVQKSYVQLRKTSLESVRETYDSIRKLSAVADRIIGEIVETYAKDLDEYVSFINRTLDDIRDSRRKDFSDMDLQRAVLRLPTIMYKLSDALDSAALESDVAKAVLESIKSVNYLNAPEGTIPEKRAYAAIQTANEEDVVQLTKHVYQRLRNRLEHADKLFDGVRKVITMRDTHKSVFGKSER